MSDPELTKFDRELAYRLRKVNKELTTAIESVCKLLEGPPRTKWQRFWSGFGVILGRGLGYGIGGIIVTLFLRYIGWYK